MKRRRRRSDRSGRAPLMSPGRPSVAGRDERRRFWVRFPHQPEANGVCERFFRTLKEQAELRPEFSAPPPKSERQ